MLCDEHDLYPSHLKAADMRGLLVAFLGPDGTGKTTLASAVATKLAQDFEPLRPRVIHWRPEILPPINAWFHFGRTSYTAEDMARPHRASVSGHFGSTLRTIYYALDYVIGHLTCISPAVQRGELVLFDRYFLDFFVDPERVRIKRGSPAVRWVSRYVPLPDLTVICMAPTAILLQRKQELPEEELCRQLNELRGLAKRLPQTMVVDTTKPLEHCVLQVSRAIRKTRRGEI